MFKELKIQANEENIGKGVEFIEQALNESGIDRSQANRSLLTVEELLHLMMQHAPGKETVIKIGVRMRKQHAVISLSARGSEFSIPNTGSANLDLAGMDEEQEAAIRNLLLNAFSDSFHLRHVRGFNRAELRVGEKKSNQASFTLACMLIGLLLGVLMRPLPTAFSTFVSNNVFSVVSTLFLNAIKMLVVPLVFFSVADSVTGFTDLKVFGRIGGKVMGLYTFTSIVAFFIGVLMIVIFHPGDPSLRDTVVAMAKTTNIQPAEAMTLQQVIIGIVPSNFLGAFVNADMLQIIFLSLIIGIASGMLGKYTEGVQNFLKAGNALFSRITKFLTATTPVAVACIMANMALKLDAGSLSALMTLLVCGVLGMAILFAFYCLLLVVLTRKSPKQFLKKFRRALLMGMSTMSSNASMPTVMECVDDMGVSPKLYSFSIPLGSTINMDGATIFYTIVIMFMMRVFGIRLNFATFAALFLNVLLMSMATPGIPNATIVMLALLFTQFGIPAGAVAFILGYNTLISIIRVPANIAGDAVVAFSVANNEGMLDEEKYYS